MPDMPPASGHDGFGSHCHCLGGEVEQPPEGWAEVGFFPRARYFIVEQDDGWHAYVDDSDRGAFT